MRPDPMLTAARMLVRVRKSGLVSRCGSSLQNRAPALTPGAYEVVKIQGRVYVF